MCDYFLIKSASSRMCQCCLSENNLKSMMDNFIFEGKVEVYSEMIMKCFAIKFQDDESTNYFICDLCILRLRDSFNFRNQVDRVQSKFEKKEDLDSTLDTSLTDMLDRLRKIIRPSALTERDNEPSNEDNSTKNVIINIKSDVPPARRKKSKDEIIETLTEWDDEPSNKDNSTNNVNKSNEDNSTNNVNKSNEGNSTNNKSEVQPTGGKRSQEEIIEFKRHYYANFIPYKLDKTDVSCKICKETFASNSNLVEHMPEHYPNLVCQICGMFAPNINRLTRHMRSHNPEMATCSICNQVMKKTSIPRHVQKHTGDNFIYSCQICPEKFSCYSSRINHMANVHQVEDLKYKCKACPKAFRISGYLATHVRKFHLQEKHVPCPDCGKLFFRRHELKQHMVKHTKERNFQCPFCLKAYGQKYTLTQHLKIHNNDKQHKCTVCERTFTQKCTLKGHMKIHEKFDF